MSLSSDSSDVPTDEWESEAEEVSGDDSPPVGGEARVCLVRTKRCALEREEFSPAFETQPFISLSPFQSARSKRFSQVVRTSCIGKACLPMASSSTWGKTTKIRGQECGIR